MPFQNISLEYGSYQQFLIIMIWALRLYENRSLSFAVI